MVDPICESVSHYSIRFLSYPLNEPHRLFIDCEDDAASFCADVPVNGARWMDAQCTRADHTIFILLLPFQYQDVLVAAMLVHGNGRRLAKADQRRFWSGQPIPIEAVNFDTRVEGFPIELVLSLTDAEQIPQFQMFKGRFYVMRIVHARG